MYPAIVAGPADRIGEPVQQPAITLGRDLQMRIVIAAGGEPGLDGVLIARSSDPSKLRVNGSGGEPILLSNVGPFQSGQANTSLQMQAAAEEGEADLVIAGRVLHPGSIRYPVRRIRVWLAPSRAFLGSPREITVSPGESFAATVFFASLLPGGASGEALVPRRHYRGTGVVPLPETKV